MAINKCSLDNILRSVLSVGNSESNMTLPPGIFSDQFNTVTSLLLNRLVELYPFDQRAVEMLEPFTAIKKTPNNKGYIYLDDNFRNLLSLGIPKKPDHKILGVTTPSGFEAAALKADAETFPIIIVSQTEWDDLVTSTYAKPTYDNPIGCFFGQKRIKVFPYDIPTVEVRYVRQEKTYRYGYIMQPDDTYISDVSTTIESEWTSAAYEPIFKAMMSLYAAYTRDTDMRDWTLILQKQGIL